MSGQGKRLMVMAGGTGGHVFPGLAVAHHLMAEGWQVRWLGTADRMEAELVPKHGIDIDFIRISGLRGKGIKALLAAPLRIFNAWRQARAIMKRFKPDVVLGMGGYVSGPGGLAAWSLGIPVVLHEQNGIAGLTNRWLAKIATRVMQAFPGAFPNAEVVGNPVRTDVLALPAPRERLAGREGAGSRAGGWRLPGGAGAQPDAAAGGRQARRCGDHLAPVWQGRAANGGAGLCRRRTATASGVRIYR
jgi:UDP-N-acetylglucosamine--N-acetylmuramyl-(pentapeptide) pyrophosphoryl-undecaprenol N-acetylglucosamine transferase